MVIDTLNRFILNCSSGFVYLCWVPSNSRKQPFLFVSSQKRWWQSCSSCCRRRWSIKFQEILPGRGHDTAISPDENWIFSHRPGRFAVMDSPLKAGICFWNAGKSSLLRSWFFQQMGDCSLPEIDFENNFGVIEFTVLVMLTTALSLHRELDPIKSFKKW